MPTPKKEPEASSVFGHNEYRSFLRAALPTTGGARGLRAALAKHLRCQPAFISRVLAEQGHLSPEHAWATAAFLGLDPDESRYFLLLLQRDRAGSQALRQLFDADLRAIANARQVVKERLKVQTQVDEQDSARYYSSWLYVAVHVMTSVPALQSAHKIAEALRLPLADIQECLNFLCRCGLVELEGSSYKMTFKRIHLGTNSPLLARHHQNWRLRTLAQLDRGAGRDLHYSVVISLSAADVTKIEEILLKAIDAKEAILKTTGEEVVYSFCVDFAPLFPA